MTFIRLHTIPTKCRCIDCNLTTKQKYLIKKSFKRYLLTDDGKYFSGLNNLSGEIGSLESVRFICSDECKILG